MTSLLDKVVRGSLGRKTRLHDEKGNFVGWRKLVTHGPQAVTSAALRLCVGYRPPVPWISYAAQSQLAEFLTPRSRVLEFGSGMSTVWYARRCGEVCSVEDDPAWYQAVSELLHRRGLKNVTYQLAQTEHDYCSFMANDSRGFDLIMIDGNHRSHCLQGALPLLRSGGILYLDNSDKDPLPIGGDMRVAEQAALSFAQARHASVTTHTDFAPTQLFVQQGLMVRVP